MARIFEQSESDPELEGRIATGRAGHATINTTMTNFLIWLNARLNFLKKASNLSDLDDVPTARANLSVYSKSELDASLNLKAAKSNVIEKGTATSYTPTNAKDPVNKGYVDSLSMIPLVWAGVPALGTSIDFQYGSKTVTAARPATGTYTITHNIGHTNYHVIATPTVATDVTGTAKASQIYYASNSFTITFANDVTSDDVDFRFIILDMTVLI